MSNKKDQLIQNLSNYLSIIQKEDFSFLNTFINEVQSLSKKLNEGEIIIPLVGEFSSGKSSLLNAIFNQRVLPVDITPTTFIVNEVRFSSNKDYIEIYYENDKEVIEGFVDLNTKDYTKAKLIKIYSSINKIPKNIVIVDIPGLSSVIAEHDEIIKEYVPKADALFVVMDINQGTLTQTTLKFLEYAKIIDKKIFLILTKADTKTEKEIEEVKRYIKNHFNFIRSIIVTSSKDGKIDEFYSLIDNVKNISEELLIENVSNKFTSICRQTIQLLNEQIGKSNLDTSEIRKQIFDIKNQIDDIKRDFEKKIDKYKMEIDSIINQAVDKFYKTLEGKTDSLADIYFNDIESFKSEFVKAVSKAEEAAIKLFQRELEVKIKEFPKDLDKILPEIDPSVSPAISNIIAGVREGLKILSLDVILPGGVIPALLANIALRILGTSKEAGGMIQKGNNENKKPGASIYINMVNKIFDKLVEEGAKILAKGYVKKTINENIREITDNFKHQLEYEGNLFFIELKEKLNEKLEELIIPYNENLQKLLEEKESKELRFKDYINNLRNSVQQLERLCSSM